MLLLQSPQPGSLRQKIAQSVFALFIVSFLFTALLFTGCKQEADEKPGFELDKRLIGTWTSTYDDSYVITNTHLTYDDGYGGGYAGTIRAVTTSGTAGVIIIEYDANKKPTYYDSYDNYGDPDHIVPLNGNFVGIYYESLTPNTSVNMGQAVNLSTYTGAETATLNQAKNKFTLGTKGDFIGEMGVYEKK
jgi:hypothetical protein